MPTRNFVLASLASLALATSTAAQCADNTFPLRLVDAAGNVVNTQPAVSRNGFPIVQFVVPSADVYLAFEPSTPSGLYYVHITDELGGIGNDEVLSTNDLLDRFVYVANNNGVIELSTPMSADPLAVTYGLGLNGDGKSILVSPMRAPADGTCEFKVWFGDNWDLTSGADNPYLLGTSTATSCSIRSFSHFAIDDGTPSDVGGTVFNDLNQNGTRDAGEPGLAGWEVLLVNGATSISTLSDVNGDYLFVDAGAGSFTTELTLQAGYSASTSIANAIESPGCAPVDGRSFGVFMQTSFSCDARTIGFWRNKHGKDLINSLMILPLLGALNIVDASGTSVVFSATEFSNYKQWLKSANASNMAYMLSAQLVAMHNNVAAGFVDGACVTNDPQLGAIAINDLMVQSLTSLLLYPSTPSGHPQRDMQQMLKNALDSANNNAHW